LSYDAAGSLTKDKDSYEYEYDYESRIVKITKDGNDIAEFAYDALGRRIQKKDLIDPNNTRRYYYNYKWQVLGEYDDNDTFKGTYVYGNYIDEVLYKPMLIYYVHDHLYSPAALVSFAATVIERYEYDAYGNCYVLEPNFAPDPDGESDYGNPYLFTGRRVDILDSGSLKIQYNRNRYYDYYTGRWLTHDPLGFLRNNDRSINVVALYALDSVPQARMDSSHNNFFNNEHNYSGHWLTQNQAYIGSGLKKQSAFAVLDQFQDGLNLYQYVGSNPTTLLDPNGTDIYLEEASNKLHRDVCVDLWKCSEELGVKPIRIGELCFSFRFKKLGWEAPSLTWLDWSSLNGGGPLRGEIYLSGFAENEACTPYSGHVRTVIKTKNTTVQQDVTWANKMLTERLEKIDTYSVLRHNCRKYSQMEFDDAP